MNRIRLLTFCSLLVSVMSACKPELKVDRFGRSGEITHLPEAVTLKEVSFMVRTHSPDAEILAHVRKRGLAEPLDDRSAAELKGVGARDTLLQALRESREVLSPAERRLFLQRMEKKNAQSEQSREEHDQWVARNRSTTSLAIWENEVRRLNEREQELNTKVQQLRAEQKKTSFSTSSNSSYQVLERQIKEIEKERAGIASEKAKLADRIREEQLK